MRKFEVVFRPLAEADLFGLYEYIATEAGPDVAGAYIDRIEATCLALETFPTAAHGAMTFGGNCGRWVSSGVRRSRFRSNEPKW